MWWNDERGNKNGLQTKVTNPHGTYRVLNKDKLETIKRLHELGLIDLEIASHLGCSRGLVSRKIREMGLR